MKASLEQASLIIDPVEGFIKSIASGLQELVTEIEVLAAMSRAGFRGSLSGQELGRRPSDCMETSLCCVRLPHVQDKMMQMITIEDYDSRRSGPPSTNRTVSIRDVDKGAYTACRDQNTASVAFLMSNVCSSDC